MLTTIGYEKSSLPDFLATLTMRNVDILVDIRERAQSRRAGFSKTALSLALNKAGIGYVHLRQLGDPADGRAAARSGDFPQFKMIFGEVMKTQAALNAVEQIRVLTDSCCVCLMCYERDYNHCHRKIVAEAVKGCSGLSISHLTVNSGAGSGNNKRRMLHPYQSATASI